ncbi:MAG: ARMT1-like domain-containing protein [Planctomycetota bacterium]
MNKPDAVGRETWTGFPLLAAPEHYRACEWDLRKATARRDYWLGLFRKHFPSLLEAYRKEAADRGEDVEMIERAAGEAADRFMAYLDLLEAGLSGPGQGERLDILTICTAREQALAAAGIADAYRLAKQTDTRHALALLPGLLDELDAMAEPARRVAVIEGVFAGNIYDLGATETAAMFADRRVDFRAVRGELKPRPWRYDALDAWLARLDGPAHRAAAVFVDNAGPDVTLGMLPLARELLKRGTDVILTANTTPSLNDVTHDELTELVDAVAEFDAVIGRARSAGRLRLIASGNHAPLIDLSRISGALAAAVDRAGVDLVVLEGMGRAVESNFNARLRCDTLKLAMIKDAGVADALEAELFDLVMKFEPGDGQ